MAYNTKPIATDKDGNPISQYYNPNTDKYEPVEGASGANKVIVEDNSLSLIPILDKLSQLTGTVIDEETRKTNETSRVDNEETRQLNEGIRSTNEIDRVNEESIRTQNENTRVQNENTRQDNEQDRVGLYNDLVNKLNTGYFDGKNLEFHWSGTSLGVRVEGETDYIYVDLKGETGDIDNLTIQHILSALGYTPANESDLIALKYSELSSTATNIDTEGIYKNIEWKRKDNTIYAISTLLGTYPYSQIKIDYYNDEGTAIIKTITWNLTYDDNEFPYKREVI